MRKPSGSSYTMRSGSVRGAFRHQHEVAGYRQIEFLMQQETVEGEPGTRSVRQLVMASKCTSRSSPMR
jgi:hypothetical protein